MQKIYKNYILNRSEKVAKKKNFFIKFYRETIKYLIIL